MAKRPPCLLVVVANRSQLSLRIAAAGGILFVVLVFFFNARFAFKEPLLSYGFPFNALVFHVGLGIAFWARLGDPAKRGAHPNWAIVANGIPVVLFWLFVYAIVQALRNFT